MYYISVITFVLLLSGWLMFNKQILVYALMMYIMQYTVTDLLIMHKDVSHEMHYSIIKDTPNG